jgi:glycosyltransferase involved in cell wall biosynthesis
MKVLVVISKFLPEYSGPSVRISDLYLRLIKKKYITTNNVYILSGGEELNSNKLFRVKSLKVKRFKNTNVSNSGINFINYVKNFLLVRKEINYFKPDLIHVIGSNILTASAIINAKTKNIPLCLELVNSSARPNQNFPILKYFWKPNLNINSKIIVISKFLKKKCLLMGYKNVWYRPNPINLNKFIKINKIKKTKKILLNVGQFIPRKNQKFLIKVIEFLPKNFKLILCGPLVSKGNKKERDLEYFNEMVYYIKSNKLTKRIIMIPKYVNVIKYLKKTDIYLMPSYDEGLGNTIIESLASGIPVIANSSEPSFREIIRNNKNGFLLKMQAKVWAKSIIKNIDTLNSKKVRTNSKNILEQSNEIRVDNNYIRIFEELVS